MNFQTLHEYPKMNETPTTDFQPSNVNFFSAPPDMTADSDQLNYMTVLLSRQTLKLFLLSTSHSFPSGWKSARPLSPYRLCVCGECLLFNFFFRVQSNKKLILEKNISGCLFLSSRDIFLNLSQSILYSLCISPLLSAALLCSKVFFFFQPFKCFLLKRKSEKKSEIFSWLEMNFSLYMPLWSNKENDHIWHGLSSVTTLRHVATGCRKNFLFSQENATQLAESFSWEFLVIKCERQLEVQGSYACVVARKLSLIIIWMSILTSNNTLSSARDYEYMKIVLIDWS